MPLSQSMPCQVRVQFRPDTKCLLNHLQRGIILDIIHLRNLASRNVPTPPPPVAITPKHTTPPVFILSPTFTHLPSDLLIIPEYQTPARRYTIDPCTSETRTNPSPLPSVPSIGCNDSIAAISSSVRYSTFSLIPFGTHHAFPVIHIRLNDTQLHALDSNDRNVRW